MAIQRRGHRTKQRILQAACKVFTEKGYRDATHAEICRRAGTNIAAINYYFESKETLYRDAFEHLTEKEQQLYPLDGGLPASAPPAERLRAFVHALLSRMFDTARLGDLHGMSMAGMFHPTGLLEGLLDRRLARDRAHVLGILRELMGPRTPRNALEWCEMSVVSQCVMVAGPPEKGPRAVFGLDVTGVDRLTDHIVAFSLAGIEAIARKSQEHADRTRIPTRANKERLSKYDEHSRE